MRLALLLLSSIAYAGELKHDALAKIDAAAQGTKTLSADFTQKSKMKLFKKELVTKGTLAFASPRKIRWEYTKPDPSLLVLDGSKATLSSPGAEPRTFDLATDPTMRAIFDQLLTFVGGSSISTAESAYTIDVTGSSSTPTVTLTPKADGPIAKTFSRIELTFDERAQVHRILLVEKSGDEKEITFGKVSRNVALPTDTFSTR